MPKVSRRTVLRTGLALSATALFRAPGLAQARTIFDKAWNDQALPAVAPREKLLFDFGWKFAFGNADDAAKDFGFGIAPNNFSKTGDFRIATTKFNDSKWRFINLPHDWAVELPFVWDETLKSHGYKPLGRGYPATSVGWYRRGFNMPASDEGRRIVLQFDGAFRDALVFVNGCFIGRNDRGYTPFTFDISDFLHYGGKNMLTVRMNATYNDGWFYEGAGIYRHVWMIKQDRLHLGQWESTVRTHIGSGNTTLDLATLVQNDGSHTESAAVHWKIVDASGNTVATAEAPAQSVAPLESASYRATASLSNPKLWSLEEPNLYTAVVTVETHGTVRDAEEVDFGVRSIRLDPDDGFFLNGKPVKVKGTCNHQDHAGVGSALPDRLQYFRLAALKSMGCNGVRTSHNMPTPEWVEACNRMGMLMLCETRTMSSSPEAMAGLSLMIKRYRNSPAIFLWSMGNEEWVLEKSSIGVPIMESMQQLANDLDPTRLCTAAVNGDYGTGISKALEVEGFNYNINTPDKYHAEHPTKPLIGTETASAIATRGIYRTDPLRNWMSAYDTNAVPWGRTAEQWWQFYDARKWLAGGFAWTGLDYRGEPTPYSWPSISSQFGIVDTCGYPKDTYYYYQSVWGDKPILHLFPHWNFEGQEGEPISVWVYSNLDEVELLVNGKSLGVKKMPALSHVQWSVNYEPGYIEARAKKNGRVVLTERRETTGKPASIKLSADRQTINADGEDVAMVRVEVLDAQGRHVPTADDLIDFKITGNGALIGVGNGDPNCHQSDKGSKRSLFNGLAQAIVQSTQQAGQIVFAASAPDSRGTVAPATLTLTTRAVKLRPQVPWV